MIDTKEIRKALAIHGVDVLNVDEVLDVLDHLEAAYKEIESWKGLARQFGNKADELRTHLSFAKDELNRLRAKIAEMEKQEPAGIAGPMPGTSGFTVTRFGADVMTDMLKSARRDYCVLEGYYTELAEKLEAAQEIKNAC